MCNFKFSAKNRSLVYWNFIKKNTHFFWCDFNFFNDTSLHPLGKLLYAIDVKKFISEALLIFFLIKFKNLFHTSEFLNKIINRSAYIIVDFRVTDFQAILLCVVGIQLIFHKFSKQTTLFNISSGNSLRLQIDICFIDIRIKNHIITNHCSNAINLYSFGGWYAVSLCITKLNYPKKSKNTN